MVAGSAESYAITGNAAAGVTSAPIPVYEEQWRVVLALVGVGQVIAALIFLIPWAVYKLYAMERNRPRGPVYTVASLSSQKDKTSLVDLNSVDMSKRTLRDFPSPKYEGVVPEDDAPHNNRERFVKSHSVKPISRKRSGAYKSKISGSSSLSDIAHKNMGDDLTEPMRVTSLEGGAGNPYPVTTASDWIQTTTKVSKGSPRATSKPAIPLLVENNDLYESPVILDQYARINKKDKEIIYASASESDYGNSSDFSPTGTRPGGHRRSPISSVLSSEFISGLATSTHYSEAEIRDVLDSSNIAADSSSAELEDRAIAYMRQIGENVPTL